MTEWYRNTEWSDEIAAEFERRIERSRTQKAQHLSLQGYHLIRNHPDVARDLLTRAVEIGDVHETVRARSFLALANLALGQVEQALDTYEVALEQQLEQPNFIAVQPVDYLFLVGWFRRVERLEVALPISEALPDEGVFGPDPQLDAAKALVFDLARRADDAAKYAARALPQLEGIPNVSALGIDIAELRDRLTALST